MSRRANIPVFQPVQTVPNKVQAALDHKKMAQTPDLGDDFRYMKERKDFMTQGIQGFQQRNRNALQRPREEALILLDRIIKIYQNKD